MDVHYSNYQSVVNGGFYKLINTSLPDVWILTFNRPVALNRLIHQLGSQGFNVNVFSNYPVVDLDPRSKVITEKVIINTLNSEESNSWCARSWNTIMMKGFSDTKKELICIQDDTMVSDDFADWILEQKEKFDFIWGPAGDQFFYLKFEVLQRTGWFDERYIGCYCGDADYLKRVYLSQMVADRMSKISVEDTHNWGFLWNPCGTSQKVITTYQSKTVDPNYDNQHWQFEKIDPENPTIKASQNHFLDKWGISLDNGKPLIESLLKKTNEIDWYPWYTKKHNIVINP